MNNTETILTVIEIQSRIDALKSQLPVKEKKVRSQKTIVRSGLNKDAKIELNTCSHVFKLVRSKYLSLPNRVKSSHIEGNEVFLKESLLTWASQSLENKGLLNFHLGRLVELLNNIELVKKVGFTVAQKATFESKVFTATNIIDALVKCLTMSETVYIAAKAAK